MHRFRKKSDAKSRQFPDYFLANEITSSDEASLPELPPASNFRTSLILPDLTRRFTLLRSSSGDPISFEDLRTRFADQRARGAENHISEEEENMILETLGQMRARNSKVSDIAEKDEANAEDGVSLMDTDHGAPSERQSVRSSQQTIASSFANSYGSVPPSPSNRSKRYSNNLFGSGRFRDYSYVRSVSSQRSGSNRSALSFTPTDAASVSARGNSSTYSESLRPVTPDGGSSVPSSSVQSSPSEKTPMVRSAPLTSSVYSDPSESDIEYHLASALSPSISKRASLALEQVIKEMEEETEDEIVMPRSNPVARGVSVVHSRVSAATTEAETVPPSLEFEAGMAISSDKQIPADLEAQRASPIYRPGTTSPTPRLPGYIPGMPRPMTPRDTSFDLDDRSHSTTPRATSPLLPVVNDLSPALRRDTNISSLRQSSRPSSPAASSPLFLPRSVNGRFTPEDSQRNDGTAVDSEIAAFTSGGGRRRPASPLSGPAYQPLMVSRPGTPSNITWTTSGNQKDHTRNDSVISGHSRNGSNADSDLDIANSVQYNLERAKSETRSLRSPALPDSPMVDHGNGFDSQWNQPIQLPAPLEYRSPPSVTASTELGSPIIMPNNGFRSPTPTQTTPRSITTSKTPSNDLFSNQNGSSRSFKPAPVTTPFTLTPLHPLIFSPIANSSRSSLESAGSSYHSWDAENKKDRPLNLFYDGDTPQLAWHDVSVDKSGSITPGETLADDWDPEGLIRRFAGLTKSDFMDIQAKLVGAATAKDSNTETRDRAPSLRRRRPSTSQSNHSLNGRENRVASPPPQTQAPSSPGARPNSDHALKANALLNSMVDSIQSSPGSSLVEPRKETAVDPPVTDGLLSRNRDLAHAIFGVEDSQSPSSYVPSQGPSTTTAGTAPLRIATASSPGSEGLHSTSSTPSTVQATSAIRSPLDPNDEAELAKDVQRRAEAATVALRKTPSNPKFAGAVNPNSSAPRKKIAPHQISTPRLVSASTSVDTIPLPSPSIASSVHQGPLRISQRIRKLRGTLRAKPLFPSGEEVTPFPLELQSPPIQVTRLSPTHLTVPGSPAGTSTTDLSRYKIPSPPASAGPGLKGFMARFRRPRTAEAPAPEYERRPPPFSPASTAPAMLPPRFILQQPQQSQSAPANTESFRRIPSPVVPSRAPPPAPIPEQAEARAAPSAGNVEGNTTALQQLFAAAEDLGLKQADVTDMLARSPSTSSRSTTGWKLLTRDKSAISSLRPDPRVASPLDRARSPVISEGRPSLDAPSTRGDDTIVRKLSLKKRPDHARPPRDGQDASINAVVRRTIIFPSESRTSTIDLNVLLRKNSQKSRRRSGSVASVSSRSIHDRVPTPPPPRSPTGRRFSHDGSPPVPQLPPSFSTQAENLLQVPGPAGGPIEKSSSAYDSLYEMYAGENKPAAAGNDTLSPDNSLSPEGVNETGPAIELIEMANGETIWSIVNGLRDDDAESFYGNRASFASEYSMRDPITDGVQVFFKEHGRKTSKDSNTSLLSRKKLLQAKTRPETKVFYSSSAQIGKLIENLSLGMESGSFNIMPNKPPGGHSHSSSFQSDTDVHWTVEERLEHMIGTMEAS